METTWNIFKVKSKFIGTKESPWSGEGNYPRNFNNHIIMVKNLKTKVKITFEFWGSKVDPVINDKYNLLNAFYCFLGDAISGESTLEEFLSDFGYDGENIKRGIKAWRACRNNSMPKANRLIQGSEFDLYEIANKLGEDYA